MYLLCTTIIIVVVFILKDLNIIMSRYIIEIHDLTFYIFFYYYTLRIHQSTEIIFGDEMNKIYFHVI